MWSLSPSLRDQVYSDVATAQDMLPNRSSFSPQFTAHGFQLIPNSSQLLTGERLSSAKDASGDVLPDALYADSVKRKRRLKMKRHKYRKRLKKERHAG